MARKSVVAQRGPNRSHLRKMRNGLRELPTSTFGCMQQLNEFLVVGFVLLFIAFVCVDILV
jgi:hypothetical protein